jgi:diguanylate cyclase (GGDEF)-like protein/PAS domain S-box-containing protein
MTFEPELTRGGREPPPRRPARGSAAPAARRAPAIDVAVHDGLFRALVEHAYDAVVLLDARGAIAWASRSVTRLLGYAPGELVGRSVLEFVHRDDLPFAELSLNECLRHPGKVVHAELRCRHQDGSFRLVEGVAVNRFDEPQVQCIVCNFRDVTDRRKAETALRISEQRYTLATRGSSDGLWDWNVETGEAYFSPRWMELLGYEADELPQALASWYGLAHADDLPRLKAEIAAHLSEGTTHFVLEHRLRHKDGTYRWMLCRGLAVRREDGTAYRMAGSLTDITDRKMAEEQLHHGASHDALTGLPNRVLLQDLLMRAMARAQRQKSYSYAVLFVDLDGFKRVNDALGHLVGDELLIAAARRLESTLRPGDTVARFGGDEFTILLDGLRLVDDALLVCERVQRSLSAPFDVAGIAVNVTASIGVAIGPGRYERLEQVLRDADVAMYRGKAAGGARVVVAEGGAACPAPTGGTS